MTLLELRGVRKTYRSLGRPPVVAVDDLYLRLAAGRFTGLVGESGSGKSTTIRCILGLERPDEGWIDYDGIRFDAATKEDRRRLRRGDPVGFHETTATLQPPMTARPLTCGG